MLLQHGYSAFEASLSGDVAGCSRLEFATQVSLLSTGARGPHSFIPVRAVSCLEAW